MLWLDMNTTIKGLLSGGLAGGLFAALGNGVFTALMGAAGGTHGGEMLVAMSFGAACLLGPVGLGLGALLGALARRRPMTVGRAAKLGALGGAGVGMFVALSLVSMAWGNRVMALLALVCLAGWGAATGAAVGLFTKGPTSA